MDAHPELALFCSEQPGPGELVSPSWFGSILRIFPPQEDLPQKSCLINTQFEALISRTSWVFLF